MARKRPWKIIAVVAALSVAAAGMTSAEAQSPTPFQLYVSKKSDRSNSIPLDGAKVSGNVSIFTNSVAATSSVTFYIDDASLVHPYRVDRLAPYDLAGNSGRKAILADISSLGPGNHQITAVRKNASVIKETKRAVFSVVAPTTVAQAGNCGKVMQQFANGRPSTLQPFSSDAFSNTSVGSGIKTDPNSQLTATVKLRNTALNSARWSFPIFVASASDPQYSVSDGKKTFSMRIPADAEAAAGTDAHMSVTQPDKRTDYEMWGAERTATGWKARYIVKTDLLTAGMTAGARASGVSHLHGDIRKEEVANLCIPHTLAMGIDGSQLKSGPVWPARLQDSHGASSYSGTIPMGTMFVIPMSADTSSLNLSPQGEALAWTLKNYGAHVLINSSTVSLYAETDAETQYPQEVKAMRADWAKLRPLLQVVTNNTENNVAGGGTRYQPPLPPVVAR